MLTRTLILNIDIIISFERKLYTYIQKKQKNNHTHTIFLCWMVFGSILNYVMAKIAQECENLQVFKQYEMFLQLGAPLMYVCIQIDYINQAV